MEFSCDEELMVQVAQGDLGAFERLVQRHEQVVWRTAYRLVGDHQAAEDIAQDAFLRILQAAPRYRPTASFRTYLYHVVVRIGLDHLRKGRPAPAGNLEETPTSFLPPDHRLASREREQAIQDALKCLPGNQRTAIVLRYFEGLTGRQIATAMETSVKAVERLLARGRCTLQTLLSNFFAD